MKTKIKLTRFKPIHGPKTRRAAGNRGHAAAHSSWVLGSANGTFKSIAVSGLAKVRQTVLPFRNDAKGCHSFEIRMLTLAMFPRRFPVQGVVIQTGLNNNAAVGLWPTGMLPIRNLIVTHHHMLRGKIEDHLSRWPSQTALLNSRHE